mmetsp:Transcript_51291/g.104329  ORF Transcript_51291/g.104329 Transcript_51291/m.104329 type:complete len:218 (+) Transcript_51291:515-1168(+)
MPDVEDVDSSSGNESDEHCPTVCDWNPDLPPLNLTITLQRVCFNATSVASDTSGCVDSGVQVNITPNEAHVIEFTGDTTNVKGIYGPARNCPNVKLGIPTVSKDGEPLILTVPGPSILDESAHGLLLSHGAMQRAGFTVALRAGTQHNPNDRGYIRIPDGRVVLLTFENDLYYLPVHTPVIGKVNYVSQQLPAPAIPASANLYHLLEDDESDPLTCG